MYWLSKVAIVDRCEYTDTIINDSKAGVKYLYLATWGNEDGTAFPFRDPIQGFEP